MLSGEFKCCAYLALGNLIFLVSVHHWDWLQPNLLHLISLQRIRTKQY